MNSRWIPWCIGATTFIVMLTVSGWQGKLGQPGQFFSPPPRTAAESPGAGLRSVASVGDHPGGRHLDSLATSPALPDDDVPRELASIPLSPEMQSELDSDIQPDIDVQPGPDDEPTVDDLPGRPDPSATPDDGPGAADHP